MKIVISVLLLFSSFIFNGRECDNSGVRVFTFESDSVKIYFLHTDKAPVTIGPDVEAGWMLKIKEKEGDFFFFEFDNYPELEYETGWIKKGKIYLNTRNYDDTVLALYTEPGFYADTSGFLYGEQTVRVLDVCNSWAYIETLDKEKQAIGWLQPDMQCGNPYTTCN